MAAKKKSSAPKKKASSPKPKGKRPPRSFFVVYDANDGGVVTVHATRKAAVAVKDEPFENGVACEGKGLEVAGPYVLAERVRQR